MFAAAESALREQRAFDGFERELGETMGQVNASAARLVRIIVRCIEQQWWQDVGTNSPEHWVAVRCGVSPSRAHRLVRIARRLGDFPVVAVDFTAGQLTEDHLDVIVREAHPSHDPQLAGAPAWTIGQLRRIIRALPIPDEPVGDTRPDDEPDDANPDPQPPADALRFGWSDDGRFRGNFDVGTRLGSLLERALRSARNRLFRERTGTDPEDDDAPSSSGAAGVSWADALERLGLAALDGLDPSTAAGGRPSDRHLALLHLDADHPERSRLHFGPLLSRSDRQLLSCDCDLRAILWRDGQPVARGRRQRVVDPILRALIEDRDGGCRIDGCDRRGWLHIHHLVHWERGGPTDPDNLVALCTEHHRLVHQGRLRLSGDPTRADGMVVLDQHGRPLPRPGPLPPTDLPPPSAPYDGPDRSGRMNLRYL